MQTRRGSLALTAALALCALPGGLTAQNKMEGVVTFRMEGANGKVDTVTQTTRGRSMRLEGYGGKTGNALIYDADQKRTIMVDGAQKRAMVMTEQDAAQMQAMSQGMRQGQGAKRDGEKPSLHFAKTGKSETVAGVKCEVWQGYTEVGGQKREGEACLAEGVGFAPFDAMASNPMFASQSNEWRQYRELVGPNKGIVKATQVVDGKPHTSLEAIKIERKAVAPELFEAPAGYTVMNMGDMMRKAQEQMKRPPAPAKPPSQ